ncbi:MAG: polyprenyl synthetase family protein [Myxococcota bacterium]|nr:polyprenyl synthetase family protein [Myxococcota bacterium]
MRYVEDIQSELASTFRLITQDAPPRLQQAMHHALFPVGGTVRPKLCLGVAHAISGQTPDLAMKAAIAVELLHCASLVHDDLPCFDDADLRRGRPTVHRAFGEEIAVLVGDGLIAAAFETVAAHQGHEADKVNQMLLILAKALGPSQGLVAGQAWESESEPSIEMVHRHKTGALFEAAAALGAISVGAPEGPWRRLGRAIGQAYQLADDLMDALGSTALSGKSSGRDALFNRPSAVRAFGLQGAVDRFSRVIDETIRAVPPCSGRAALVDLVQQMAVRLCPPGLRERVSRLYPVLDETPLATGSVAVN